MEILEKVQQQLKKLNEVRAEQQQMIGQRDAILKQLQDMGYKTVDEAKIALKELETQRNEVSTHLTALSQEMDLIITQARASSQST
jgi:flagellar biosynthesis chaperone FliJ